MNKKGFSLVELSIVIIAIGILIAGSFQGYSIYQKTKLETARSMTKGSPVNGVMGLILWLDATAPEAFGTSIDNNQKISRWTEDNPHSQVKNSATQNNPSLQPTYVSSGINGLPAVFCDGIDDILTIPLNSSYLTNPPTTSNDFTIFVVARANSTHEIDAQNNSSTFGTSGQKYLIGAQHGGETFNSSEIAGAGISFGTNGISIYEHTNSYMPAIAVYSSPGQINRPALITLVYQNKIPKIFLNGAEVVTGLTSQKRIVFPSNQFCSGYYGAFNGNIGEIIVFGQDIAQKKRDQIEAYLGKKWGIKVN